MQKAKFPRNKSRFAGYPEKISMTHTLPRCGLSTSPKSQPYASVFTVYMILVSDKFKRYILSIHFKSGGTNLEK